MEKIKVTFSKKYITQLNEMNILENVANPNTLSYKGKIKMVDSDLIILKDTTDNDVCGILDGATFYKVLLETDVAHLFSNSKNHLN
ncbi:unnamed protein product [marine sediment metagenome]|uniref:Uncharacterized protein n=1 Tax=marine sediment metagenome TaxID=412755 RepID=X0RPJ7_9ZZZZ